MIRPLVMLFVLMSNFSMAMEERESFSDEQILQYISKLEPYYRQREHIYPSSIMLTPAALAFVILVSHIIFDKMSPEFVLVSIVIINICSAGAHSCKEHMLEKIIAN